MFTPGSVNPSVWYKNLGVSSLPAVASSFSPALMRNEPRKMFNGSEVNLAPSGKIKNPKGSKILQNSLLVLRNHFS